MVLALVGSIGVTASMAATPVVSDNYDGISGGTNLFGLDQAQNGVQALPDRDVGMPGGFDFSAGDRWSPFPPYHHNDL